MNILMRAFSRMPRRWHAVRLLCALAATLVMPAGFAIAQDAADLLVRLGRMEEQIRQLNGQVEQLQFQNRRLEDQLRRFQTDVDFRFREGGRAPSGSATPPATPPRQQRGDAFDPSQQPAAPGSPRPLGSPGGAVAVPGQIIIGDDNALGRDPTAPLDLSNRPPTGGATASIGPAATAKDEIDAAKAQLARREYDLAESAFRDFLRNRPRDRLAGEAVMGLGDSLLQRQRWREAAEQFVDYSTRFPRGARGAEAQLKLAISLRGLGATQEACAVLSDVTRKFPNASPGIRQGVQRESQRANCG
jgi:TolA-binding protein